jgi:hypothetical protein
VNGGFAFGLDPDVFLAIGFIIGLAAAIAGYTAGRRLGLSASGTQSAALSTALGASFTIIGLVLSFSFSFALGRFEERRRLILAEAQDLSTASLRADVLASGERRAFLAALHRYGQLRLDVYGEAADGGLAHKTRAASANQAAAVWSPASRLLVHSPNSASLALVQSVNALFDDGMAQEAAASFRLRRPTLVLIAFVALAATFLIGFTFGHSQSRLWLVSVLYVLLVVLLVYVIVELNSPEGGFIQLDFTPLVRAVQAIPQ